MEKKERSEITSYSGDKKFINSGKFFIHSDNDVMAENEPRD